MSNSTRETNINKNSTFGYFLDSVSQDKFLIILPLLTIIVRLLIFLFIPHTYEDAFITFRYAENLAEGLGLVYNIGENVYGTTTPLFAIILAFFKLLGIPCVISSLGINLIAEGITSVIIYKFLKEYSKEFIAVIIALLYVFSPSNISWSIQGMETAFFGSVIALSFFTLYKRKYFASLLLGFLCAMIRIDGLSVAAIIFLFVFYQEKLKAFKLLLMPFTVFVGWLIFLQLYFGSFLPNSMIAKLILYSGHQTSIIPNLKLVFEKFFLMGFYSSTITTLLFFFGIFILVKNRINLYPMVIWFFLYYSSLIISRTAFHGWYFIPPLFVYISISGVGIIFLFNSIQKKLNINKNFLNAVFLIIVILFSSLVLYLKIVQISEEYQYEQNVRIKAGVYLKENTQENSTIYLEPIGIIGYFAERYIYDDAALVSPIFLELNRLPDVPETVYKKIQFVKPDYLVLRNIHLDEFSKTTELYKEYKAIKEFKNSSNPDETRFHTLTIFERIKS